MGIMFFPEVGEQIPADLDLPVDEPALLAHVAPLTKQQLLQQLSVLICYDPGLLRGSRDFCCPTGNLFSLLHCGQSDPPQQFLVRSV